MGYSTDFTGQFVLDKALTKEHEEILLKFSSTRRMARDLTKLGMSDEEAAKYGSEGAYYVDGKGFQGQDKDPSVIAGNRPPEGQPGLWCQWIPKHDGTAIVWDEGEKFYAYVEWIKYLIVHFLEIWGHKLNGEVKWQGEDINDRGKITIVDNEVSVTELE